MRIVPAHVFRTLRSLHIVRTVINQPEQGKTVQPTTTLPGTSDINQKSTASPITIGQRRVFKSPTAPTAPIWAYSTQLPAYSPPPLLCHTALLRVAQIVGNPKAIPPVPALIPIGRSTWWQWVRDGKAPAPLKLSVRTTAWRSADIYALIESLNGGDAKKTGG